MNLSHSNLIIRDLPCIADLEVKLLLERNAYDGAVEDFCKAASLKLFGIWVTEDSEIVELHYNKLSRIFDLADDEVMTRMLALGVDFSNERGQPLRCTLGLAASAEVAARGIAGHLPNQSIDRFASNLERDRDAFMAKSRKAQLR